MADYLRGQLAAKAGVNIETLRYYEQIGLLPAPSRTEAGYRLYSEDTLARLRLIHGAKRCGFTLKELRKAFAQAADGGSGSGIGIGDFVALIERKIAAIDAEIAKREQTKTLLTGLKASLTSEDRSAEVAAVLDMLKVNGLRHPLDGAQP